MANTAMKKDPSLRVLDRALRETRELLNREGVNYDEIHNAKSILYVAIERTGMKAERLLYSQRLLRELFSIVAVKGDLRNHERQAGLQILDELKSRTHTL